MLTEREKADVFHTVRIELVKMFGILDNHYSRPKYQEALPELEKIETYLREKLAEYEPTALRHKQLR